jgi:hypothetical protein
MIQTKMRNRYVVVGRAAPASKKTGRGEPTPKRFVGQRIVIISNGKYVGGNRKS